MSYKLVLERLLLQFIFDKNKSSKQVSAVDIRSFPSSLQFTQEFVTAYTQFLQVFVPQKITQVFGWHSFFIHNNDITRRCCVTDAIFWKDLKFRFTEETAHILWQTLMKKKKISWKKVNCWDALFLVMKEEKWKDNRTDTWLITKSDSWVILAYFLFLKAKTFNYEKFPYNVFFEKPKKIPYPIRFLLIQFSSEYYKKVINMLEKLNPNSKSSKKNSNVNFYETSFWHWKNRIEEVMCFETVIKAYEYWCNEGSIGYDDADFLQKHEREMLLQKNIATIRALDKSIGQILPQEIQNE